MTKTDQLVINETFKVQEKGLKHIQSLNIWKTGNGVFSKIDSLLFINKYMNKKAFVDLLVWL